MRYLLSLIIFVAILWVAYLLNAFLEKIALHVGYPKEDYNSILGAIGIAILLNTVRSFIPKKE